MSLWDGGRRPSRTSPLAPSAPRPTQVLISGKSGGDEDAGIDVADLRAHAHYAGGYHEEHPVVALLWEAVAGFSPEQQHAFLRFVTACSRAPLLGFRCARACVRACTSRRQVSTPQCGDAEVAERSPCVVGRVHCRYLEPQLCVQMAGSVLDPDATKRLPTAATCLNMLKLPPYS